jgi:hypothetical protein
MHWWYAESALRTHSNQGMIKVMAGLEPEKSETFVSWENATVPWCYRVLIQRHLPLNIQRHPTLFVQHHGL